MLKGARSLVIFAMLAALLAVVPLAAGAAAGNADAAHACRQGGFQYFYRLDGSGFQNVGDCVSYVARGGRFLSTGSSPSLTLTSDVAGTSFTVNVVGSDLRPGSAVWLYVYTLAGTSSARQLGSATADGTYSGRSIAYSCGSLESIRASGTAADGTAVTSPLFTAPC